MLRGMCHATEAMSFENNPSKSTCIHREAACWNWTANHTHMHLVVHDAAGTMELPGRRVVDLSAKLNRLWGGKHQPQYNMSACGVHVYRQVRRGVLQTS